MILGGLLCYPQALRCVEIPKPSGGVRQLRIPTVVDRLIQQALHQVLSPLFELDFSESSFRYFRLAEVKGIFEELDGWLRRKLRCLLWRRWKRNFTRAKNLMKRGLEKLRAWKNSVNGRGAWWNAGASHLNEAFPKSYFDGCGLISLLGQLRKLQFST